MCEIVLPVEIKYNLEFNVNTLFSAMVSGQLKIIGSEKRTVSSKLTTVSVPYSLSTQFLKVSSANNLKNLETCGILFGSLSGNEIKITHCLVPKQTGTHDSCTTTNEEQILEFQGNVPSFSVHVIASS